MAFGLSGLTTQTFMVGADATVAWVDNREGTPNAVDYFLTARVQCRAGEGACPDTMVSRNGQQCMNDVRSNSIAGASGITTSNASSSQDPSHQVSNEIMKEYFGHARIYKVKLMSVHPNYSWLDDNPGCDYNFLENEQMSCKSPYVTSTLVRNSYR